MGRGRQKAKQTKVARALKYYSPETDYERLQRELHGDRPPEPDVFDSEADDSEDDDVDDYDDEYDDWGQSSGR